MKEILNSLNFGLVRNEFINLYSKENPILFTNDTGYCLFTNIVDYHRPLIAKVTIIEDIFMDSLHKIYYVKIDEIIEPQAVFDEFINGQNFFTYNVENGIISKKRPTLLGTNFDFSSNFFKIDAFFMRDTEENIFKLRKEYISVIKKDIEKQLSDINSILI